MRTAVRDVLDRSPAFQSLPPDEQQAVAEDLAQVVAYLEDPATLEAASGSAALGDVVGAVDFPAFVTDLIQGVFQAILDASLQQMEAYADLLASVAKALDDFAADAGQEGDRDHLMQRHAQLATMVLMGVNRIVVADGEIKAQVDFDVRARDDEESD